jgi:hypothetical protein
MPGLQGLEQSLQVSLAVIDVDPLRVAAAAETGPQDDLVVVRLNEHRKMCEKICPVPTTSIV